MIENCHETATYNLSFSHTINGYSCCKSILGCFIDQIGNRDLSIFIGDHEQLTPKQCILACRAQNFLYAAIQYGNECRCGQQYGKYGQVSDEECDYLCLTGEKCGGDYRNSVYNVANSIDQSDTDSSLLMEKLSRVKRAIATNDSTQATDVSSTSTLLSNSTSWDTTSITSLPISSSINSNTTSSIPNSTNNISTLVYSSFEMSNIPSSTPISSTNTGEIIITTSSLSTSTISFNSTSSINASQSSINLVTNTMNSTTSSPGTDTSEAITNATSSLISTMTSVSTISDSLSSNSIVSNNSSNFSSTMTTESSTMSSITSTYSTEIITTISSSISSTSSFPNTSFISSNTFASNSTIIGMQTTVITSSLPTDITVQTSITITNISTTTTAISQAVNSTVQQTSVTTSNISTTTPQTMNSTVLTTTVPLSYVIFTIITVPFTANFDPNANATRENIRIRLNNIINLAFQCLTDSSYPNCTQSGKRRKRQLCSNGFIVDLISAITQISNTSTSTEYLVQYIVTNPCNQNSLISPAQVRTATDTLSTSIITALLSYGYDGDLIRSTSIGSTANPVSDQKLWIIGAVLGPVAFALLLICLFCYLHYKCRPRPTNRSLTKVTSNTPTTSPRAPNYETVVKEKPIVEKDLHVLTQNDPLVGASLSSARRLTPIQSEKILTDPVKYPISNEVPIDEIRRQNDVERWRNKLRLEEKFQPSSISNTNRSEPNQYDNRAFEHDPSNINIQPVNEIISKYSPRPLPKPTEIQAGRTKLHRLIDEALDKTDSDEIYNPDSDVERQKRRRQRRRIHSISNEQQSPTLNQQIPHIPVIPQVTERPDPKLVRLRYNPYEAGDRVHDISRQTPVELKPKYTNDDDQRYSQYSSRSNPPLFHDDLTIADRVATATDAFANPKRYGKARLETDREADMRHDGGRIEQRQHKFEGDAVYLDTLPKNRDGYRVQARTVWVEPDTDNDSLVKNDYLTAKRSVANTRNIISSIHDELKHISGPKSGDYLA